MENDIAYAILYMGVLLAVVMGAVASMVSGLWILGVILLAVLLGLLSIPFIIFGVAFHKYSNTNKKGNN